MKLEHSIKEQGASNIVTVLKKFIDAKDRYYTMNDLVEILELAKKEIMDTPIDILL